MSGEKTVEPRIAGLPRAAVFVLLGVVALAVGIGAVVYHFHAEKRRAWAEIQKRLDAIRAAGEPVTADDLAKLYPDPPPERDAKLLLAPAVAAYREPDSPDDLPFHGSAGLPPRGAALPMEMRTNMEAALKDNQPALNAIPWDTITNAWVGASFAVGFTNMPEYRVSSARDLAKMLYVQAILEAESGNGGMAAESLRRGVALFHLFRSAVLVEHLLRRNGEDYFCEALERVINVSEIPTADLASLEGSLADARLGGLRDAYLTLRCRNIYGMTMMRGSPYATAQYFALDEGKLEAVKSQLLNLYLAYSGRYYTDADFTEMLDVRAAQIAALGLPPKQRFAEFARLKDQVASKSGRPSWAATFAGAALDFSKATVADAETSTKMAVARAALEVERWRRAHGGRAPDSLAELAPEFAPSIPLDPFDNNPLGYKKLAKGFIVYSIGPDFADDGGKEKPAGSSDSEHYDITFSVER